MADEQVRIDIVADDKASKPIDALAKKVDKLEDPVKVPIVADTDSAERDVAGLLTKVDRLARDPATILLATNAAAIAGDIAGLIIDLDRLDAADPDVQIKVDQINALQGDLDSVEGKLKAIGGTPVAIDTSKAKKGLEDVRKSADSSKSVLANMVGNTTQDLGALGGVAGSAGVAIGQMGEYMADAKADGEGMASVLKSFGTVAVPLAAIGVITKVITDEFARNAKAAEANEKQVVDLYQAFKEGQSVLSVFAKTLRDTGKLEFQVGDIVADLNAVNLSVKEFSRLAALPPDQLQAWTTAQRALVTEGTPAYDAMRTVVFALAQANAEAAEATQRHDATVQALGDHVTTEREAILAANIAQRGRVDVLDDAAKASSDTARETAGLTRSTMLAEQAARNMTQAWDELTGRLDTEQAIANIGSDFDDMRTKGAAAWDETARGTADAEAAQDAYAQSVRDAKGDVVNLGQQIGLSLPAVKKMLLQIDAGQIDDVERSLNIMARNRTMNLSIIASGGAGYSTGPGGIGGPKSYVPPAPEVAPVTVNVHVPRGTRPDDVVRAGDRYARRNGRSRAFRR